MAVSQGQSCGHVHRPFRQASRVGCVSLPYNCVTGLKRPSGRVTSSLEALPFGPDEAGPGESALGVHAGWRRFLSNRPRPQLSRKAISGLATCMSPCGSAPTRKRSKIRELSVTIPLTCQIS